MLLINAIDLTRADSLEITISEDGTRIWIEIDGSNRVRIYNINQLKITDRRTLREKT